MKFVENPEVASKFKTYPKKVRSKMYFLRQLIIDTAKKNQEIEVLEETLKWGEPSYICKYGSTVRINWSNSKPDQYAMYFHCKTTLVDTFKEIYGDVFTFEGNRAIIFHINEDIALEKLEHCITMSLSYHKIKHLPLLGA